MIIKAEDKKFATICAVYTELLKRRKAENWFNHVKLFKEAQEKVNKLTETEIDLYWEKS